MNDYQIVREALKDADFAFTGNVSVNVGFITFKITQALAALARIEAESKARAAFLNYREAQAHYNNTEHGE